jgi:hypothetical protein
MADTIPGFDPDVFRTNIHFAMNMGLPQDTAQRPTFHFKATKTFPAGTLLDSEGTPLDPRVPATISAPDPVQVPCAVEFQTTRNDDESLVGTFRQTAASLTLLDVDYDLVKDAIEVALNGVRFNIGYAEPPIGMGTVTIYTLHCFPKGENG